MTKASRLHGEVKSRCYGDCLEELDLTEEYFWYHLFEINCIYNIILLASFLFAAIFLYPYQLFSTLIILELTQNDTRVKFVLLWKYIVACKQIFMYKKRLISWAGGVLTGEHPW